MTAPTQLTERFGEPKRSGDWYIWYPDGKDFYSGQSNRICWKPGMSYAVRKSGEDTIERIQVGEGLNWFRTFRKPRTAPEIDWQVPKRNSERWDYLKKRGLTDSEIYEHACLQVGYPKDVFFPILEDGKMLNWQSRNIDPSPRETKYRTGSPEDGWVRGSALVWGLDRVRPGEPVYVCEGIFDALYFETGVAILGRVFYRTQAVKILDRKPSVVHLCHDNEQHLGDAFLDRHYQWLDTIRGLRRDVRLVIQTPEGDAKDFGELVAQGKRFEVE